MMFCDDCGNNLDVVPVADPCPRCGGERRSATVSPETARAVARAHNAGTVTESNHPDGTEEVVVGAGDGRAAKSMVRDGFQHQDYQWYSTGQENERAAIHRFRDALNRISGHRQWSGECAFELTDTRPEVDGWLLPSGMPTNYSCDDGPPQGSLLCQVVRVEQKTREDRGLAVRTGKTVKATEQYDDLVGAVLHAIEGKEPDAVGDVVLLLDANDAPAFVRNRDVGDGASSALAGNDDPPTGWRAIWLVGMNCYRVWPPPQRQDPSRQP